MYARAVLDKRAWARRPITVGRRNLRPFTVYRAYSDEAFSSSMNTESLSNRGIIHRPSGHSSEEPNSDASSALSVLFVPPSVAVAEVGLPLQVSYRQSSVIFTAPAT